MSADFFKHNSLFKSLMLAIIVLGIFSNCEKNGDVDSDVIFDPLNGHPTISKAEDALLSTLYQEMKNQDFPYTEDLEQLKNDFLAAKEKLEITKTSIYNGADNKTTTIIAIAPKEEVVDDVTVFEIIPKEVAQSVSDVTFETPPSRIIKDDPIVMWHLTPEYGLELKYTVDGNHTENTILSPVFYGRLLYDERNDALYKTIYMGNQRWMAENLTYLPEVSPITEGSDSIGHNYVYGYNGSDTNEAKATSYYNTYGALYNWTIAQEACPSGWHLPSVSEWSEMANFALEYVGIVVDENTGYGGNWRQAGRLLKSRGTIEDGNGLWKKDKDDPGGIDFYGFTGLPGGMAGVSGQNFNSEAEFAHWWTTEETNSKRAPQADLVYLTDQLKIMDNNKENGFSVRCIKD